MTLQMSLKVDGFDASGAEFSTCGHFRYRLWRRWDASARVRTVNFIMLNPSTADAEADDPTIRRCIGFARDWGYGQLVVTNLFAFRATDPAEMMRAADPIGPDNNAHIRRAAQSADLVVCAWGTEGTHRGRAHQVRTLLRDIELHFIRLTAGGQPGHPLYVPAKAIALPLPSVGDHTSVPLKEGAR